LGYYVCVPQKSTRRQSNRITIGYEQRKSAYKSIQLESLNLRIDIPPSQRHAHIYTTLSRVKNETQHTTMSWLCIFAKGTRMSTVPHAFSPRCGHGKTPGREMHRARGPAIKLDGSQRKQEKSCKREKRLKRDGSTKVSTQGP